jgi:hypothetical protein
MKGGGEAIKANRTNAGWKVGRLLAIAFYCIGTVYYAMCLVEMLAKSR